MNERWTATRADHRGRRFSLGLGSRTFSMKINHKTLSLLVACCRLAGKGGASQGQCGAIADDGVAQTNSSFYGG